MGDYARYVGRVGALAVALGVGLTVGTSPGSAWASPDETNTPGDPPDSQPADQGTGAAKVVPQSTSPNGRQNDGPTDPGNVSGIAGGTAGGVVNGDPGSTKVTSGPAGADPRDGGVVSTGGAQSSGTGVSPSGTPASDPPVEPAGPLTAPPPQTPVDLGEITPPTITPPVVVPPSSPPLQSGSTPPLPTNPAAPEKDSKVNPGGVQPGGAAFDRTLDTGQAPQAGDGDDNAEGNGSGTATFSARLTTLDAPAAPAALAGQVTPIPVPPEAVSPAPDPIAAFVGPIVSLASAVINALVQLPAALLSGPAAPGQTPALFLVLAWVRREFDRTLANQSPTFTASPVTTSQSDQGVITGKVTATDSDGDPLAYRIVGAPTTGRVTIDRTTGVFTYQATPEQLANGDTVTFTVAATETNAISHVHAAGTTDTATATITIAVTRPGANAGPVATDPPTVGRPSAQGVVTGNFNVTDPDGNPLTYTVTGNPTYGSVQIDPITGTFVYTPTDAARKQAALSTGTTESDVFTVSVSDGRAAPLTVVVGDVPVAELAVNSVIATVTVGSGPTAVESSGTRTYIANTDGDTVTVVDTATNVTIATLSVGDRPVDIAFNADGTRAYIANAGGRSVTVIDSSLAVPAVVDTLQIGREATGLAVSPDGTRLFTTNTDSTVTIVTLATRSQITVAVDPAAIAFTPGGRYAYLVNNVDGIVTVLDTTDNSIADTIVLGGNPYGIVIDRTGDRAYVTNTATGDVSVIDIANGNALRTPIRVGDQPYGIAINADGTRLYVANFGDDTVSVVDTATGTVTSVRVGNGPKGIDVSADGTQLTVTNSIDDTFTVLILRGNSVPVAVLTTNAADPVTGVVTGSLRGTDPDGDPLVYTLTTDAAKGTVTLGADGAFTYTPDAGVLHGAAATAGADADSFTLTVDDGRGGLTAAVVNVELAPQNAAPTVDPIIGSPASGIVTIVVNGIDPDGDTLTYTVTAPAGGIVRSTAPGVFTYTPSAAARSAAAASLGVDTDTFTITADDGHGERVVSTVTVQVAPTNVVGEVSLAGQPGTSGFNATGTRAIVSAYDAATGTTRLVLVDTTTGTSIGGPVTVTGQLSEYQPPLFNSDGTRAAVLSTRYDAATERSSTQLVVIDTATGAALAGPVLVGDTAVDGTQAVALRFTADGRHVTLVRNSYEDQFVNRVVTVDAVTGQQVGSTLVLTGQRVGDVVFVAGATRAVITTRTTTATPEVRVYVVDTVSGSQLGNTVVTPGYSSQDARTLFTTDGTRAIVSAIGQSNDTTFTVVDTATGARVGTALTLTGTAPANVSVASADRFVVTTSAAGGSQVAVVDAVTGAQVGSTTVLDGYPAQGELKISADGTRTALAYNTYGANPTYRIVLIDNGTGTQLGSGVTTAGAQNGTTRFLDDGRLLATITAVNDYSTGTATTYVTVLDTTTGARVGTPAVLLGAGGQYVQVLDDQRLFMTTRSVDQSTNVTTTRIFVVDAATGAQRGSTVVVTGEVGEIVATADGTRVAVSTQSYDQTIGTTRARAVLVDTVTGQQIGSTLGGLAETNAINVRFSGDGTRATVYVYGYRQQTGVTTGSVSVVNTATGAQVGQTLDVVGRAVEYRISPDGSRAVVLATTGNYGEETTSAVVFDTTTGTAIGNAVVVDGTGTPTFSADGGHVVVTTYVRDDGTGAFTTRVALIAAATGQQVGDTLAFDGSAPPVVFSSDGTRVTVVHGEYGVGPTYLTVVALDGNRAPTVNPAAGVTNTSTGAVTGTLGTADADGDALAYTVVRQGGQGTVTLGAGGTYSYVPNRAARFDAAASPGPDTDTFTVAIDDGRGGLSLSTITVTVAPAGVVAETVAQGSPAGGLQVSPTGDRAVQVNYVRDPLTNGLTPQVVLIDTATGAQVGSPLLVTESANSANVRFSPDGDLATVVATRYDPATNTSATYVTVLDTRTGAVVGSTTAAPGSGVFAVLPFSPDGDRFVLTTNVYDPATNTVRARVTVIDTATGQQVGTATEQAGEAAGAPVFSPDGTRIYQTSTGQGGSRVTVIDAATGVQIGEPITVSGGAASGVRFSPGGDLAYLATSLYSPDTGFTGQVVKIDTATGTVVGTPIPLSGSAAGTYPSPDGSHLVQVSGASGKVQFVVIDAATGQQVGTPTALNGINNMDLQFSADGTKAFQTIYAGSGPFSFDSTAVVVIDVATGTTTTITAAGSPRGVVRFSPDGTRAIQISGGANATVIDVATGTQIGNRITVVGNESGVSFSPDGTKAYVTTFDGASSIAVIDLATGARAGTLALSGDIPVGGLVFGPTGTRAFQLQHVSSTQNSPSATRIVEIDTATNTLTGRSIAIEGASYNSGGLQFSADGTRAYLTTTPDSGGQAIVTVLDPSVFLTGFAPSSPGASAPSSEFDV